MSPRSVYELAPTSQTTREAPATPPASFAPIPPPVVPMGRRDPDPPGPHPLERLIGREADEIVPILQEGDPLNIHETVMRIVREEALVLDPSRVFEQSTVEVAVEASLCELWQIHPDWLDRCVHRAIERILNIDRVSEERSFGRPPSDPAPYKFTEHAFCTPEDYGRTASVRFHALPLATRRLFFHLVINDVQPDEALRRNWGDEETLRWTLWDCFVALGLCTQEEREDFQRECQKKLEREARRESKKRKASEEQGGSAIEVEE